MSVHNKVSTEQNKPASAAIDLKEAALQLAQLVYDIYKEQEHANTLVEGQNNADNSQDK